MKAGSSARRRQRLSRRLLQVACADAASCVALTVVACATRSRPSGREYTAIARVAVISFLPGAAAVLLEQPPRAASPRIALPVLLVSAGSVISTVGTIRILTRVLPQHGSTRPTVATDIALLIAGNAIGVPYLTLILRLHRTP